MPVRFQMVIDCTNPDRLAASGPPRWATSLSRLRLASLPGTITTAMSECPRAVPIGTRTTLIRMKGHPRR